MTLGKSTVLFSGQPLTNSYVYRSLDTLGYAKTSILIRADETGSGIGYILRGYLSPREGNQKLILDTPHVITSGQLTTSGQTTLITSGLDLAYTALDLGVKADVADRSGVVTASEVRRRY